MSDEPELQPQRADAEHEQDDGGTPILDWQDEKQEQKVEPPPLYNIVMLNDDFTPMEFVVSLLTHYFGKTEEAAAMIMLSVHKSGKGIAGTFPKDIAETKVAMIDQVSQGEGHPFKCEVEQA